ncbi:hypothetical protein DFH94DRAFT_687163 [Russula ochroleuca]|uniref:Uncharacterized protein n=1 Tax=Russula ochroleuca TaxID=152965 RepID=A0A9P5JUI2_9AGAM|nr:hypothetical protein DFH94DRAFT_687163 [Russula ochroleuca]
MPLPFSQTRHVQTKLNSRELTINQVQLLGRDHVHVRTSKTQPSLIQNFVTAAREISISSRPRTVRLSSLTIVLDVSASSGFPSSRGHPKVPADKLHGRFSGLWWVCSENQLLEGSLVLPKRRQCLRQFLLRRVRGEAGHRSRGRVVRHTHVKCAVDVRTLSARVYEDALDLAKTLEDGVDVGLEEGERLQYTGMGTRVRAASGTGTGNMGERTTRVNRFWVIWNSSPASGVDDEVMGDEGLRIAELRPFFGSDKVEMSGRVLDFEDKYEKNRVP